MRLLSAALLLAPTLALAQVPLRPSRPVPPRAIPPAQREVPQPGSPAPAPGAAATPTPAPATPGGGSAETLRASNDKCVPLQGRFMLSFNKADIVDVLEQASRWTCRNFVYTDDVARGKITLLSKTPVTADEAYLAFLAALQTNNISIYPTGKYYKLVRIADAKKTPIPTIVGEGETPASEQPITRILRLQFADPDQVRGIMGNFISPQGADIQSIPPDMLIITDIGLNIRRIEKLIDAIDKAGAGDMLRIVQIRYAAAKDIADKVNQIFQAGGAGGGARPGGRRAGQRVAAPAAPGQPAPAAAGAIEVSVSKLIPDERTNKLIIIADDKSFERIQELIAQLDVPTAGEGGIHVVFLKNANAEDLAQTLSNLAQGQSRRQGSAAAPVPLPAGVPQPPAARAQAGGGDATAELFAGDVKITADKTQNALLVQASGADFVAIQRLIDRLDRPRRQVFVEAVILEVNLRNENQLGVGAHTAIPFDYKGEKGIIPLASQPGRVSSFNLNSVISLGGFLTGFTGPVSAELKDLGINLPSIGLLVQALQTSSDVNVLSTPHILATDNEEAEITVGQNVPFQAGFAPQGIQNLLTTGNASNSNATGAALGSLLGAGGTSSLFAPIQRQPVELRLKIKPQINEGGNVRLTIDEQIEEITDRDAQLGPTTSKRSVKTQITARDQSTIVIGGIIQDRTVRSIRKVPFLGSLPLLGWLFRDTTTTKSKTNLLVFLTPYIIRDESDYRRIYEKKKKEQEDFITQFYGRQPAYAVDVDFSRKAGPFQHLRRGVDEETRKLENGGAGAPGEGVVSPPPEAPPFPGGAPRRAPVPEGGPPPAPPQEPFPPQGGHDGGVETLPVQPDVPPPVPQPQEPPE
jgi:general secretion pathway protein D